MSTKEAKEEKPKLHPRNRNRNRYDLQAMVISCPQLAAYIQPNKLGADSINFSDPIAVKLLNKAILHQYYNISYWEFSDDNLCPPIPGRAEYIHHIADLLSENNNGIIPLGSSVTCLDIGVGASCIYPIIGISEYNWNFIASDIDPQSLKSSQKIINSNPSLIGKVTYKTQNQVKNIFKGIVNKNDKIDISICNPPFHSSAAEALKGSKRKTRNLTGQNKNWPQLNFSGNKNELVYQGGELQFAANMISESLEFRQNILWFSLLISKASNLKSIYKLLKKNQPKEVKTINIKTGNKTSRIVAWTYFSSEQTSNWKEKKWNN